MNYNYYIADVFTDRLFNGAQIAVFPNADGLNHLQMTAIAKELNRLQIATARGKQWTATAVRNLLAR